MQPQQSQKRPGATKGGDSAHLPQYVPHLLTFRSMKGSGSALFGWKECEPVLTWRQVRPIQRPKSWMEGSSVVRTTEMTFESEERSPDQKTVLNTDLLAWSDGLPLLLVAVRLINQPAKTLTTYNGVNKRTKQSSTHTEDPMDQQHGHIRPTARDIAQCPPYPPSFNTVPSDFRRGPPSPNQALRCQHGKHYTYPSCWKVKSAPRVHQVNDLPHDCLENTLSWNLTDSPNLGGTSKRSPPKPTKRWPPHSKTYKEQQQLPSRQGEGQREKGKQEMINKLYLSLVHK